jgi:hypothetical protein
MGTAGKPSKVKLFCGFLFADEAVKNEAVEKLEKTLGKIDLESDVIPFDFSSYYKQEMGANIKRVWVSFTKLISEEKLADIKVFTNSVESFFAVDGKRIINIDPGLLRLSNIILATTKDYSHRIYLSKGIYAEITTIYKEGGFVKLPWTYPDYLSKTAENFMIKAREALLKT